MEIVVIGGGTGSISVLKGLKPYKNLHLSAIVNMTDDGGSNQAIRDEFGLLPLSDLRKSIIALSDDNENEVLRKIFMYRFDKGIGISGHTLGNLFMTALSDIAGSEQEAVKVACKIFNVKGNVIPVTLEQGRLVAEYRNGDAILGEHHIDEPTINVDSRITKLYSIPSINANSEAIEAIHNADFIVIGPGDLYTTTIANLIVRGIPEAISSCKAKVIYISNIMSKFGQTRTMTACDHVDEITKYSHRSPDYIIVNNGELPKEGLQRYLSTGEHIIADNLSESNWKATVLRKDIVGNKDIPTKPGDILVRSYIRHDARKLARVLRGIFSSKY